MPPTISPSRARWVRPARKPRGVQPSSIGSVTGPTPRIWKKWSISQIESKPASSAVRAIRPRVGAIAAVPPGQVNESIWRPIFIPDLPLNGPPARLERKAYWWAPNLAEEVPLGWDQGLADRPLTKARPGTSNDGDRTAGNLPQGQPGGRRNLVGPGAHGRTHRSAIGVDRAPQVLERQEARHTDRDVDDPPAPWPAEGGRLHPRTAHPP